MISGLTESTSRYCVFLDMNILGTRKQVLETKARRGKKGGESTHLPTKSTGHAALQGASCDPTILVLYRSGLLDRASTPIDSSTVDVFCFTFTKYIR